MKTGKTVLAVFALAVVTTLSAQEPAKIDTTTVTGISKEEKNRNVMLNAADASKPRELSIGLPSTVGGTDIFEDGLPVSYYFWPHIPFKHWRGGASYGMPKLNSLTETALRSGNLGYSIDSYTRTGTDEFKGFLNYNANQFGMHKFDFNVSGPIANGWSYTASVFQNFDPGSNTPAFTDYQDRTQIYKAGITKVWNQGRGKASLFYKYSNSKQATDNAAPFYYVGDGSTKEMEGFRLGHDSYMPNDGKMTYMDVQTGKMITSNLGDMGYDHANELAFNLDYTFNNDLQLTAYAKYKSSNSNICNNGASGLDNVTIDKGYTLTDGTPYEGAVQNRFMMYYQGYSDDLLATVELKKRAGNHALRLGLSNWYNRASVATSTASYAHKVEANPDRLYFNGQETWAYNTGGEYDKGHENKLALYLSDDWKVTPRFDLSYGLRMEYYTVSGTSYMNEPGATNNNRGPGFNLAQDGVTPSRFSHSWLNPVATVSAIYRVLPTAGITAEYMFNRQRPRLEDFAGSDYPTLDPVDIQTARGGIFYNNKWMKLVSAVTYIRKTNYKSRVQFTQSIGGVSETQTKAVNYDIATLGWTTDVVLTPFKGFALHALFTLQKPEYKGYNTTLNFSDGSTQSYDFSNKVVTGVSQVLAEIDPSYQIRDWRFWMSFRYFGKEYANKPNSLYFNAHWETFGGIDYRVNKYLSVNASIINIFNTTGAKGSIGAADLMEDVSEFNNYLMSGSYIRPFTVEFGAKISF